MIKDSKLTTLDNPHNPFTDWDMWYAFDTLLGHHTIAYLDRLVGVSDVFDDMAREYAMSEIVEHNLSGQHIIVTANTFDALINTEP